MGDSLLSALPINELVFFTNKGLLGGLIIGSAYALGAVGVTLIFGILRFAHFAHGDMMTAGAFFSFLAVLLFPDIGSLVGLPSSFLLMPIAMAATALLGIMLDRLFYRPLRASGAKPVVTVMASIGVMLMLQGLVRLLAGTGTRQIEPEPKAIHRLPVEDGTIVVTQPQLLLIGFTVCRCRLARLSLEVAQRQGNAGDGGQRRSRPRFRDRARCRNPHDMGDCRRAGGRRRYASCARRNLEARPLFQPAPADFRCRDRGRHRPAFGRGGGRTAGGFAETFAVFNWSVVLRPLSVLVPQGTEIPNRLAFVPTEYKLVVPFLILVFVLIWRPTGIFRGSTVLK